MADPVWDRETSYSKGSVLFFLKQLFDLFAELKFFKDPEANRASDGRSWFCR